MFSSCIVCGLALLPVFRYTRYDMKEVYTMDHVLRTVEDLQAKLRKQEQEVIDTKKTINSLLRMVGREPIFTEGQLAPELSLGGIKADTFYGQPLATAVRKYLEMRRASSQGPASVSEIYQALTQGGYDFATSPENAKRILRISMSKNTPLFHRLPNKNVFGLVSWYPDIKTKRSKGADEEQESTDTEGVQDVKEDAVDGKKAASGN